MKTDSLIMWKHKWEICMKREEEEEEIVSSLPLCFDVIATTTISIGKIEGGGKKSHQLICNLRFQMLRWCHKHRRTYNGDFILIRSDYEELLYIILN